MHQLRLSLIGIPHNHISQGRTLCDKKLSLFKCLYKYIYIRIEKYQNIQFQQTRIITEMELTTLVERRIANDFLFGVQKEPIILGCVWFNVKYFPKMLFSRKEIFSSVLLHYENCSRKYFHVFGNILKMLFSTTTHTKPTTTQQENHQNTTTHTTTTTKKLEIKERK